jgi:sodium/proline symporter
MNALARASHAVTLSDMLVFGMTNSEGKLVRIFSALFLATFLSVYVAAQWLAGEKFLAGSFGLTTYTALLLFAVSIIGYSSLGGFRGSIFTDTVQAVIRLAGTVIALAVVLHQALLDTGLFWQNLGQAGPNFLSVFPRGFLYSLAFVGGFAFAAIGFGLGQPQVASRYMAGRSPEETQAAWWIYIGFIQFTWVAMSLFGVALRGVIPNIPDPEAGLSILFRERVGGVLTGIIFADVFATIASTSNGILVAITQILERDLLGRIRVSSSGRNASMALTIAVGGLTIILSLLLPGNVFTLAVGAVSSIGAGIAGPMVIKLFAWRHTGSSLLVAMLMGIASALTWKWLGLSDTFNEAGVGMAVSLLTNVLVARAQDRRAAA